MTTRLLMRVGRPLRAGVQRSRDRPPCRARPRYPDAATRRSSAAGPGEPPSRRTSPVTDGGARCRRGGDRRGRRAACAVSASAHLSGPQFVDERPRLRAAGGSASGRLPRATDDLRPTSWCSTPALSVNAPTQAVRATSAIWPRASAPIPTCKSRSVAWRKRPRRRKAGRRGWIVVFGNLQSRCWSARHNKVAQVEIAEALQQFPVALSSRESAYAAGFHPVGQTTAASFARPVAAGGGRPQPGRHPAEVRSL